MPDTSRIPKKLEALAAKATEFANEPQLHKAFTQATDDHGAWQEAEKDPHGFLAERGIEIPDGMAVSFFTGKPSDPKMPKDDYQFVVIRMTRCVKYWVGKPAQQIEICFGIQIVPHPIRGGPIA